jgi:hypothetical protein
MNPGAIQANDSRICRSAVAQASDGEGRAPSAIRRISGRSSASRRTTPAAQASAGGSAAAIASSRPVAAVNARRNRVCR